MFVIRPTTTNTRYSILCLFIIIIKKNLKDQLMEEELKFEEDEEVKDD